MTVGASGAVGSAREWHSRGHGFDPRLVHHFFFQGDNRPTVAAFPARLGRLTFCLLAQVQLVGIPTVNRIRELPLRLR